MKSRSKLEKVGGSAVIARKWAIPKARPLPQQVENTQEPENRDKLNIFIFKFKN
jgi:hypothetical protein